MFYENPGPFLQLGDQLEQELIGHYKLFDSTSTWRHGENRQISDSGIDAKSGGVLTSPAETETTRPLNFSTASSLRFGHITT